MDNECYECFNIAKNNLQDILNEFLSDPNNFKTDDPITKQYVLPKIECAYFKAKQQRIIDQTKKMNDRERQDFVSKIVPKIKKED